MWAFVSSPVRLRNVPCRDACGAAPLLNLNSGIGANHSCGALSSLLTPSAPDALAEDGDEHVGRAGGTGREEVDHLIVEGGRADRSQPQTVRAEMQFAGRERAFKLGQPVAAIAVVLQHRTEVGQVVAVDVSVAGVLLTSRQSRGLLAEVSLSDQLDRAARRMVQVDAGRDPLDAAHDQIEVMERLPAPGG